MDINTSLDKNSNTLALNERYLESQLECIKRVYPRSEKIYWLTVARLNELALLCAGNYADSGEFQAAGDLLANPRLILIHTRDSVKPAAKRRHGALSRQFSFPGETREETLERLKKECFPEIKKEPLLPLLYKMLDNAGCFCPAYLDDSRSRMRKIAEVITLLAAWNIPAGLSLHERLQSAGNGDKEFVSCNLCRFDDRLFRRLGDEIRQTVISNHHQSEFLI